MRPGGGGAAGAGSQEKTGSSHSASSFSSVSVETRFVTLRHGLKTHTRLCVTSRTVCVPPFMRLRHTIQPAMTSATDCPTLMLAACSDAASTTLSMADAEAGPPRGGG